MGVGKKQISEHRWLNPNNNTWVIKEIEDDKAVSFTIVPGDPVPWFSPMDYAPEGYAPWDFRGAIIKVHMYGSNFGTVIATLQLACDGYPTVDPWYTVSGDISLVDLAYVTGWGGELAIVHTLSDCDVMMHFTATTFWGQEFWC